MEPYRIKPTRLAGGLVAVEAERDDTGFARPADFLARNFGRWNHRWQGYVMSPTAAALLVAMFAEGWTGGIMGGLYPPDKSLGRFESVREAARYRKRHPVAA